MEDIHAIIMRNAISSAMSTLPAPDGRPYFGGQQQRPESESVARNLRARQHERRASVNVTAQLRKNFASGCPRASGTAHDAQQPESTKSRACCAERAGEGRPNRPELSSPNSGRAIGSSDPHVHQAWSPSLKTGSASRGGGEETVRGSGRQPVFFIYSATERRWPAGTTSSTSA